MFYRSVNRSIYNPKYLAFLASRAVHKAVFLVPKLDAEVFRAMLFDNIGERVLRFLFFSSIRSLYCFDLSSELPLRSLLKS